MGIQAITDLSSGIYAGDTKKKKYEDLKDIYNLNTSYNL